MGFIVQSLTALATVSFDFEFNFLYLFLYKPWRLFIFIGSLVSAFIWIALFYFPESPQYFLVMQQEANALKVLQTVYKINTGLTVIVYFSFSYQ